MERKEKITVKRFKRGRAEPLTAKSPSATVTDFIDVISPGNSRSDRETGVQASVVVML